jgi:hypothetical protein
VFKNFPFNCLFKGNFMMKHQLNSLLALMTALALLAGCAATSPGSSSATKAEPAPATASGGKSADDKTQRVKGLNDWEGDITGTPAPGSSFTKLQIGMGMRQVNDIVGRPTDQGAYITGKAFIPWYFGSDRYRHEMVYKGVGRLIFAGGSMGDYSSGNLIWIIHNAAEPGYR